MEAIGNWLEGIILLILLATVTEFLLPTGVFTPYARMVLSLLLLVVILQPILILLQQGGEGTWQERLFAELSPPPQEASPLSAQVMAQVQERQWERETALAIWEEVEPELLRRFSVRVEEVAVKLSPVRQLQEAPLQSLTLVVAPAEEEAASEGSPIAVPRVEVTPVEVTRSSGDWRGGDVRREGGSATSSAVREYLCQRYDLRPEQVEVHFLPP